MNPGMTKAPGDVLDYDLLFFKWLGEGDNVQQATATIGGDTTAIVDRIYPYAAENVVKVWISGGADGDSGTVTVTAKTRAGRTKVLEFPLKIRECF